jgi:CMP-N-acetylneuraminic acid synthetase
MSFSNVLAVIPARKNSKRFPGKNMALFQGLPLVQNTIRIAKAAGIEKILVTTDDPLVAATVPYGYAEVMSRPEDLCTDDTRTEPVVENAVHYAASAPEGQQWEFDTICLLQVTSPLLHQDAMQRAIEVYIETESTSLTAVNLLYEPVGAFYLVDRELFMKDKSLYQAGGGLYRLSADQCIDVDHPYQLQIANIIAAGRTM